MMLLKCPETRELPKLEAHTSTGDYVSHILSYRLTPHFRLKIYFGIKTIQLIYSSINELSLTLYLQSV